MCNEIPYLGTGPSAKTAYGGIGPGELCHCELFVDNTRIPSRVHYPAGAYISSSTNSLVSKSRVHIDPLPPTEFPVELDLGVSTSLVYCEDIPESAIPKIRSMVSQSLVYISDNIDRESPVNSLVSTSRTHVSEPLGVASSRAQTWAWIDTIVRPNTKSLAVENTRILSQVHIDGGPSSRPAEVNSGKVGSRVYIADTGVCRCSNKLTAIMQKAEPMTSYNTLCTAS